MIDMVFYYGTGRRSVRLKGYDYRDGGTYFVTICTQNRESILGEIRNGMMGLSDIGCVVARELQNTEIVRPYVTMDTWIIMPNHMHMIVWIHPSDCACCRTNNIGDHCRGVMHDAPTDTTIIPRLIGPPSESLGGIVQGFKSACTRQINIQRNQSAPSIWQRNYHEHIIRSENERLRIRHYIMNNPAHWNIDPDAIL